MRNEPGAEPTIPDAREYPAEKWTTPTLRQTEFPSQSFSDAPPPLVPYPPVYSGPPAKAARRGIPWFVWLIGGCLGALALVVLAVAVLAGLLVSTVVNMTHQEAQTATQTQTFTVSGAPTIEVTNPVGNVTIERGSTSSVTVRATSSAQDATSTQTQRDLESITVNTSQHGNTISVTVSMNEVDGLLGGNRHVDIDVMVPQQSTAHVDLSVGDLTVSGVSGRLVAKVDTGSITLSGGTLADGSQVQSNVGSITYQGALAPGADVSMQANTGSISLTLPADTATNLDASASVGSIDVSGWDMPISRDTTGQSLTGTLGSPNSGVLHLRTGVGSIDVRQG